MLDNDVFHVFRSINSLDLRFGIPAWCANGLWFVGFIISVIGGQYYFLVVCLALHFILLMLTKNVDVHFLDIIKSYASQSHGDLE